ncbi:MAG: EamA family transporter [Verrucomicrobia bacterium]|nr:EamA family transporter [Verrucomicrobiota bacterium]
MTKILVILIAGLVCEAIGVVFLSKGLKQIGEVRHVHAAEIWRVVKAGATNPSILLGVALETIFFIALLVLLSRSDVSFIWPLTAMGFVLTTLAAKFFLQEQIPPLRWLGVLLIMLGAGLITFSEKVKEREQSATPTGLAPPR